MASRPNRQIDRRISQAPSPFMAYAIPWLLVILGSVVPAWPVIVTAPLMPPFGFLVLLGWRQLRPGLLPVWSGFPLGLIDDLCSGQPMGSAMLLWSVSMMALDIIEFRFPWRSFVMEWAVASGMITAYLVCTTLIANASGGASPLLQVLPQIILAILLYPVVGRAVARCDQFRLTRFRVIG